MKQCWPKKPRAPARLAERQLRPNPGAPREGGKGPDREQRPKPRPSSPPKRWPVMIICHERATLPIILTVIITLSILNGSLQCGRPNLTISRYDSADAPDSAFPDRSRALGLHTSYGSQFFTPIYLCTQAGRHACLTSASKTAVLGCTCPL